jgi:uncharacterized protein YecT (DUF1311 family)
VEPQRAPGVAKPMRKVNPTVIVLLAGVAILILLVAFFATNRSADQDKLGDNATIEASPRDPAKRCGATSTYDLIKRDLFRRAAEMRGTDQAAYDKLAAYAVVRMENPVLESEDKDTGALNCSGLLSLDLPPGVAVVGGRRTLTANIDYTLQPAADGSGEVVLLNNADPIVAPLATLARIGEPAAQPGASMQSNVVVPVDPLAPVPEAPTAAPPAAPSRARPSFDCADARTRGEIAVCSDSGIAALDVNMAAQYRRALATATPAQRALLQSTRDRFLAFRDRCPDRTCIANAYTGRMREIRDIAEGRWQPPR